MLYEHLCQLGMWDGGSNYIYYTHYHIITTLLHLILMIVSIPTIPEILVSFQSLKHTAPIITIVSLCVRFHSLPRNIQERNSLPILI